MGVLKNWNSNPALGCVNDFGAQFSTSNYVADLAADTDTTLLVPDFSGIGKLNDTNPKIFAVFGYESASTVFVANGASAEPALGAAFTQESSVINPSCREVKGGDILHFYSVAGNAVSVSFYAI